MSTYKVGLEFNAKTGAIDEAANKLNGVQNTIKALSGRDPFSVLANGAQGLANASKAAKQQLSDQTSAIRAQQVAQRDLLKELDNLKKKQIELNAAAKGRANGGAFTKDEIQGLKNVSAQLDQTKARYEAGKKTLVAYRHEVEKLNKAQASGGGGGGIVGGLAGMAGNFAPAISGMAAIAGTAALAAGAVAGAGAAVVAAIKPMVDFTNVVDRNRQQLTMFTHDAAKTEEIIKSLQRTADATSLGLPGLLEATKTMAAYGIEAENAGAATKMLGDLALGDNEKLQRFSVNLAQISSLGKAYTVDLKQFGMAGIPIFAALSKTMGKSTAEIMKMAEEGKITYPIVIKALQSLTAAGADFYNGAETGGTEMDRAMNQLTGAWEKLSILIGNAVTPAVVSTFKMLADILNAITTAVKDAVNEIQWFVLGLKDAYKNSGLKDFISSLSEVNGLFKQMSDSKFLAFMMNPGTLLLPPGLREIAALALQYQDAKNKNPKNKVDNAAANELERRKLAESALAEDRKRAIAEHAKLETDLAKERAALNKQLGRSLAEAERGYAVQLADFRISQLDKIAALERTMADERRTAEFKLAQDRQALLDKTKDYAANDEIRAARGRGEDTGGLELAQKLAAISSKSAADRKQAAFDQRTKEIELQRRLSDFKIETQKQIGEMAKAYARQVEGIYRTAAQTLNDKLIAAALESKKILESVKIPTADNGANGGGGKETAGAIPGAGTKAASKAVDAAGKNLGLMAGISEQCANSLRELFKVSKINIGVTKKAWDGMPTSAGMANSFFGDDIGVKITNIKDLRKGDLIAFEKTYGKWGKGVQTHVGMAAGDGQMFDHSTRKGVTKRSIEGTFPGKFMYGMRPHEYQRGEKSQAEIDTRAKAMVKPQQPKPTQPLSAFTVQQPKTALEIFTAGDPKLAKAAKPVTAKPAQAKLPNQITAPGETALQQQLRGGAANGIRPSTLGGGGIPLTSPGLEKSTNALMQTGQQSGKVAELQKELEVTEQIKALIYGMNQSRETELISAKAKNELDVATLELMKSGVTPELAAQLALNQQQNQIYTANLEAAKLQIAGELEKKGLAEETRKEKELQLKLINEQLAANPALLAGLDAEAQKTKAIGEAREAFTNSQKVKNHMETLQKDLNDTQGKIVQLSQTIEGEMGSAMSSALTGLIDGTQKADQAFAQMFKNIGKAFIDMATQMIAKALVMKALGILFPGAGAAAGGGGGVVSGNGGAGFSQAFAGWGGSGSSGFSFAGGGYTGDAPRAGGIDGQGGFPAILHPQETVTDHSRMAGAMQRYSPAGSGNQASANEGSQTAEGAASSVEVSYNVTEINSMRFVSEDQFQAGLVMAAKRGAESGHAKVMGDLSNKRSTRSRLGL